eukprot:gene20702-27506_t
MGVRTKTQDPGLESQGFPVDEEPLEIWEVVVQIEMPSGPTKSLANPSGFKYTPVRMKQKAVHGNTVTVNEDKMLQLTWGNKSVPMGYEERAV